jgi:hypothetical protein
MRIESDTDFKELRKQFSVWKKRFPMFTHDVYQIEDIVEKHIQKYSIALVSYRQSKHKTHLERAQREIDEINRVLALIEKIELMAMLSRG